MKNKNLLKFITISFFLIFIFSVPIITLFTEDKKISEIENKILTQLPRISFENICNKKFMKNFDEYTSDQFPLRANFIKLKNTYNYIIGQREFRDIYVGKNNKLMEKYKFNKESVDKLIRPSAAQPKIVGFNQGEGGKALLQLMSGDISVEECIKLIDQDRIATLESFSQE